MSGAQTWPALQTLRLADGRLIAWYEFGDPAGVPCLYVPGTPESGLAGSCYDAAARQAGVRWLSVDKPGYGHSDPVWNRSLLGFAADLGQLADGLELASFVVVGESGGGPHALAAGVGLEERTDAILLLGSAGVGGRQRLPHGMTPMNTMLIRCLRFGARGVRIPLSLMAFIVQRESPFAPLAWLLDRGMPDADRLAAANAEYALRLQAVPDAFRQGSRPAAEELAMIYRTWDFEPQDVTVPVHMWHGHGDANVPIALAEDLSRRLPDVRTHFYPESAHTVGFDHRAEVMRVASSYARPRGADHMTNQPEEEPSAR